MRRDIIEHLINLDLPIQEIRSQLRTLPWDSDEEILLTKRAAKSVLERYINGHLDLDILVEWANIIEGRDDVCFDPSCSQDLKQLVFDLANPQLQGSISNDIAKDWLSKLT